MPTERLLQLTLGIQIALAAFLLYVGQGAIWITYIVILIELGAFILVDKYNLLSLNRFWINAITLSAAAYCAYDVLVNASPFQMAVSTANTLLFMEMTLLFRKKSVHTYWLLLLLSFFQVIVGAAFRQQPSFGLILIVFMGLALCSLGLLLFYRQRQMTLGVDLEEKSILDELWNKYINRESNDIQTASTSTIEEPNPLKNTVTAIDKNQNQFPFCGRIFFVLSRICFLSVFLCAIFFLFMPRFGEGAYLGFSAEGSGAAAVGFNDTIRLGELGPSKQNTAVVCQVELFRGDTAEAAPKVNELYLRGTALNVYDIKKWSFDNLVEYDTNPQPTTRLKRFRNLTVEPNSNSAAFDSQAPLTTRVSYEINPTGRLEAFAVWPFYPRREQEFRTIFTFNGIDQRIHRREYFSRQALTYEMYAPSIQNGFQVEITPKVYPQEQASLLQIPTDYSGKLSVPSAEKLARLWLQEGNLSVEKNGVEEVARYFTRKLRDSGDYLYSINPQKRNRNLDPIEDFLSEHKTGHCEFFASALVTILRSVGIPCQIIVGYMTNEYSKFGHYYTVRQSHAHAWVQVWIPPEELNLHDFTIFGTEIANQPAPRVPRDSFDYYKNTWLPSDWRYGAWLRLDPTPGISAEETQVNAFLDWFGSLFDWMNVQWEKYLIKLDSATQQTQVYDPLKSFLTKSKWVQRWFILLNQIPPEFVLAGLIISFLTLYWLYKLIKWLWKLYCFRFNPGGNQRKARTARIDFYRRFEKAMNRIGFIRSPDQTPMEFALEIESRRPEFLNWSISPREIAAEYYSVRFGGQAVSPNWINKMTAQLKGVSKK